MGTGMEIQINPEWCKGCGICVQFCPMKVLGLVEGKVQMLLPEGCVKCRQCEMRCPDYAIWLEKAAENEGEEGRNG
jgi:2-oxoglutarate ferredoxin oxidoreductase subunit delta